MKSLFLVLLFSSFATNVFAYSVHVSQKSNKQVVVIDGTFEFSNTGSLGLSDIIPGKNIELHLNSNGGRVTVAVRLNQELNNACGKEQGCVISAKVFRTCASACSLLFFNASERYISSSGKLQIHASRLVKRDQDGEVTNIETVNAVQTFSLMHMWGYPLDLLQAVGIEAFQSEGLTTLNAKMLLDRKVIKGIIP